MLLFVSLSSRQDSTLLATSLLFHTKEYKSSPELSVDQDVVFPPIHPASRLNPQQSNNRRQTTSTYRRSWLNQSHPRLYNISSHRSSSNWPSPRQHQFQNHWRQWRANRLGLEEMGKTDTTGWALESDQRPKGIKVDHVSRETPLIIQAHVTNTRKASKSSTHPISWQGIPGGNAKAPMPKSPTYGIARQLSSSNIKALMAAEKEG